MRDSVSSNNTVSSITADALSDYFVDKVSSIRDDSCNAAPATYAVRTDQSLDDFRTCTLEEVRRIILDSPPKQCSLDPIPTVI